MLPAPDRLQDLVARNDAPGVGDEICDQIEFLRRQIERTAVAACFALLGIDANAGGLVRRLGRDGPGALEECTYSGEELGDFEGLAQVVVRTRFKTGNDVVRLGARGQHEDRNGRPLLADVPGDVDAVDPGKHQVE